jgi:hypothetical protein
MEGKTFISIGIFLRGVYTSGIRITRVVSASIIVIAIYREGKTSTVGVTRILVTLIIIQASVRRICNYTPQSFITIGVMTPIRRIALI